ncbi:hypothetical protein [Streptomyces dangxiongensis]|uniref:hypothetical protein n=1 Tax=Streptomyces dangxiongensis TaxID=1442032 RepID=UPI0013CEBB34|nr:hypothetical protein [Streptomyces dangxiongensis]
MPRARAARRPPGTPHTRLPGRRPGGLPAWTGWAALAAGAVCLAGSAVSVARSGWPAPLSPPSVTPFVLFWPRVAGVSVVMLRLPTRNLPGGEG